MLAFALTRTPQRHAYDAPQSNLDSDSFVDVDPDSQLLPLKETSNVIVLARLQELRSMSAVNFFIAIDMFERRT